MGEKLGYLLGPSSRAWICWIGTTMEVAKDLSSEKLWQLNSPLLRTGSPHSFRWEENHIWLHDARQLSGDIWPRSHEHCNFGFVSRTSSKTFLRTVVETPILSLMCFGGLRCSDSHTCLRGDNERTPRGFLLKDKVDKWELGSKIATLPEKNNGWGPSKNPPPAHGVKSHRTGLVAKCLNRLPGKTVILSSDQLDTVGMKHDLLLSSIFLLANAFWRRKVKASVEEGIFSSYVRKLLRLTLNLLDALGSSLGASRMAFRPWEEHQPKLTVFTGMFVTLLLPSKTIHRIVKHVKQW